MTARRRILLTGGAGFIGSHIALVLLETQLYNVTILDTFVNSKEAVIRQVRRLSGTQETGRIEVVSGDIRDEQLLQSLFREHARKNDPIVAVIHLAALKDVGEGETKAQLYYDVNVRGTKVLLDVMAQNGCRYIVFSSSAAVYGNAKVIPAREDCDTKPVSVYGKTKLEAEEVIRRVCSPESRLCAVVLRYFNPAGAHPSGLLGEDPRGMAVNLPARLAQVAARGESTEAKIQIFGSDYDTIDGTGLRDYIHIMDLAEGHVKALGRLLEGDYTGGKDAREAFTVFNIGSGKEQSVLQLVEGMAKASSFEYEIDFVTRRPGDVARLSADIGKAEKELGFTATRSMEDMCTHLWKWQSSHPDGLDLN
ncbi:hypothetical protein CBS101457_002986 [Exobasidium rhododendri]|nr:hypothetical protein CBS101457_002986 [Exobasidium rhododendri]